MIGAEELGLSLDRIRVVTADTAQSPNEGTTASSLSLETSGNAIRNAAAEARQILLEAAGEQLDAPMERLTVVNGLITDPATGRQVTYWGLFGGKKFNTKVMGFGFLKSPEDYHIVGRSIHRLDLLNKVIGRARFVQDLDLPKMVHGRVVRPPNYRAKLVSMHDEAVRSMPGVLEVVRDGNFLAVIAEREEQAVQAMTALSQSVIWETEGSLPTHETLFDHMLNQTDQAFLVVDGTPGDDRRPLKRSGE